MVKKSIDMIKNIDEYVGILIMVVILIDVFLQILSRIIPGNAISWTLELGEILLGALIWMTISVGVARNTHVSFDLVIKRLPIKATKVCVIIANFIFIIYLVFLGVFTVQILRYYLVLHQTTTMLDISKFWVRMPILIGCIMTALRLCIKQYRLMTNKEEIKFSDVTVEKGIE
ncbi:MAG TPA: TRAP transporter small permease [Nitrospirota bacterium]|nr:TRAP transporter small permease [Nitrospirota bacterium]